ncbi:MAG: hypothetical protein COU31_02795 [Candidatus Magasanikbacteria bacterium CG10_big_fil_rev_8_21_14_0_10_40_10]|uniref:RiboL-PSP-HEPN domain-containing protein n=1 Tax=Candidatus Magasanikbacteria bacterium CG10_big_fil_rev_8_21_14_0_10_40_10 TaxID=1974648 RepID=A0A2M6W3V9_9BACT|nr:MAG: hypothetical protein COU31_02795 [Candidatus Magasanikbacteria bacterium CG10_big_fil_rev_8_21_14_0_10_40_10]
MKSIDSVQLFQKIDSVISDIKSFTLPQSATTYLAKFLVVYICGIYEEIIESTITEMVKNLNKNEVSNFVKKSLDKLFRNPNMDKIIELFSMFENQTWMAELKNLSQSSKTALNSIVENKNSLAHGQSLSMMTISDIENYYIQSKIVIEKIDDLLLQ